MESDVLILAHGVSAREDLPLPFRFAVAGALLALGAARFISSHLTMIPPFDAIAFVSGMATVLAAALAAAYGPSKWAASVDVVESLKG